MAKFPELSTNQFTATWCLHTKMERRLLIFLCTFMKLDVFLARFLYVLFIDIKATFPQSFEVTFILTRPYCTGGESYVSTPSAPLRCQDSMKRRISFWQNEVIKESISDEITRNFCLTYLVCNNSAIWFFKRTLELNCTYC